MNGVNSTLTVSSPLLRSMAFAKERATDTRRRDAKTARPHLQIPECRVNSVSKSTPESGKQQPHTVRAQNNDADRNLPRCPVLKRDSFKHCLHLNEQVHYPDPESNEKDVTDREAGGKIIA